MRGKTEFFGAEMPARRKKTNEECAFSQKRVFPQKSSPKSLDTSPRFYYNIICYADNYLKIQKEDVTNAENLSA